MLARNRDGQMLYEIADARVQQVARVRSAGEMTEADAPPELRIFWTMENWQAGVGGVVDRQHKQRLAKSTQIDGTVRGVLRPGRAFTDVNSDTAPDDHHPSGFATVATELWSFQGRDVFLWDFTNEQWDIKTEPEAAGLVYRNGVEFNANTFVPAWDETGDAPSIYIFKSDNDTQWTQSTGRKYMKYLVNARDSGGTPALFAGHLALFATPTAETGSDWSDSDTTLNVDDGSLFAAGDYIMLGTQNTDLLDDEIILVTAIVSNALTVVRGVLGTTAASHNTDPTDMDVYDYLPHHIMSSTSPTNTAQSWTATTAIGSSDAEITALVQDGETLIICKTDGMYALFTDGTVRNLTPEYESRQHPDNFRNAFNWNGHIILPLGNGGLWELWDGRLYDISMLLYAPDQTQWHGRVVAVGGTPTELFITVLDSTNTKYHMFLAEWFAFEGRIDWRWHHIGELSYTTDKVDNHATIFAEGQSEGTDVHSRVWFGVESTGSDLNPHYYPLAGDSDDTFDNGSNMIAFFPDFDAGFPRIDKNCVSVDVDSNNLGAAGRQWTFKYNLDGGSDLTDLTDSAGNADGIADATGGAETLTFPAGTTCKILTLQAIPASTAETSTAPEITKIRATFQLRPERLRLLPMTFYLADVQRLLNGGLGGRPNGVLAQLRTWDAQAAAVTVTDIEGTARDYVFLPGNMRIRPRPKSSLRRREWLVDVLLAQE